MSQPFAAVMAGRTDDELLEVIASPAGAYRDEALQAAREEAAKRQLTIPTQVEVDDANRALNGSRAEVALDFGWVLASVLIPLAGIPWLLLASNFERTGYARKARTLRRIAWSTVALYALVILTVLIIVKTRSAH